MLAPQRSLLHSQHVTVRHHPAVFCVQRKCVQRRAPPPITAAATSDWQIITALTLASSAGIVAAARTRIGAAASAPLISMGCGLAFTAVGMLPIDCGAYDVVWKHLMPLAAALYLLETDFSAQGSTESGALLAAFAVGAVGMTVGACLAYQLLRAYMGKEAKQLAACLCASYVGGSTNFAAVSQIVGLSAASIPSIMAVDNIAMAVCLALLMAWASRLQAAASNPSIRHSSTSSTPDPQNEALESSSRSSSSEGSSSGNKPHHIDRAQPPFTDTGQHQPVTAESLSLALAAAAASCASGGALAHALHVPNLSLAFMSVAAVGVAYGTSLARSAWRSRPNDRQLRPSFAGAAQVGQALMGTFFCVIGASAGSMRDCVCRPETPAVLGFIAVMVCTHWAFLCCSYRAFSRLLPIPAILLGSNACIGGPATAAGLAASKGWVKMVQASMMCGSLGYASGTTAGIIVAKLVGLSL